MDREIQVSIICNAYNHEKYIRDALEGFIMQKTKFAFEVLVHDDASTDSTAKIIREYEANYPDLIKPIYQTENQYSKRDGTIRRLQGDRVRGKYIALCEGDDYWVDPNKLQKQYDFMEENPEYTLCGCTTQWLNVLTGKVDIREKTKEDRDFSLEELLFPKNGRPFTTVSFFVRSDIWKNVPKWGFPVGDLPLTYYSAIQGKVRMLHEPMCVYRWFAEGSWTARNSNDAKRAEICRKMIIGITNMNQDLDYQYDELLSRRIRGYQYTLALMNHDFKAIQSADLIGIYTSRNFIHRLSDRIRCKMPKLYLLVQKMLGRK